MAGTPSPESAQRAADFTGSTGVNTHIAWSGPWANWANIESELAFVGVANVRDSTPYANFTLAEYQRLAAQGVKFDVITSGPTVDLATDMARIDALETSKSGSVASIEGTNEFNVNHDTLNGQSSFGNPRWGAGLDAALSRAVAADTKLSDKTVVAASFANAGAAEIQQQGNVSSSVGASNWHAYFSQGAQPGPNIKTAVSNASAVAPGRPVYLSESGYYTAVDAQDWGGGGVSEDAQAKMTVSLLLDAYKDGASKTFLYELMDNTTNPASTDLEDSFGLFHGDGTPKASATALHNLTSLLADKTANASSFAPGTLSYNLSGTTAQDNSQLLEKSNGSFDLALWNEQPIWNETGRSELAASTHDVTLILGQAAEVKTYDVLTGSLIARASGTKSVDIAVSDRPMIVEVTPTIAGLAAATFANVASANVPCFTLGTLICTTIGDVPVELLVVGDQVITASKAARPIRWIGRRSYSGRFANVNPDVLPVLLTANSLEEGVPARDLCVSPNHAMYIDGMLIPAECLVNGVSIIKTIRVDRVDYFHLELEEHDILLAEGAPTESFVDDESRGLFHNAPDYAALHIAATCAKSAYCAPRVIDGFALEAVKRRLLQRAKRNGRVVRKSA